MMEKIMQALKLSLVKVYRSRFRILATGVALALLLCLLHYYTNNKVSAASMSLNYSEASAGLNPNSTRFNISELVSEDVMSRVVKAAGLEDEVTWEELAQCVSVKSVDKGSSSNGYISTSYQISYDRGELDKKPENMPSPDDMIKLICTTYKSYFLDNYGDNKSILSYEPLVSAEDEPYISLSSLEVKLNQIYRYINMRMKENKTYTDEETGANFISLMKDVENLTDYDLVNIYSFILETGISKDKDTLVSLESYKNRIDGLSYDKYMAFYDSDNYGIELYDEAMSAIVMIPSVDKANEYYMSRTKTAADTMATNADYELKEAISYKKAITDTNYVINQIGKTSAAPHKNLRTAVSMIVELNDSINRIAEELKMLDISYIKHKTQNYLVFNYSEKSFVQKINLKLTAVELAAAVVIFYVVTFIVCFEQAKKERKKTKDAKI